MTLWHPRDDVVHQMPWLSQIICLWQWESSLVVAAAEESKTHPKIKAQLSFDMPNYPSTVWRHPGWRGGYERDCSQQQCSKGITFSSISTENDPLRHLILESWLYRHCGNNLQLVFKSIRIATTPILSCAWCNLKCHSNIEMTSLPRGKHPWTSDFAVNCQHIDVCTPKSS